MRKYLAAVLLAAAMVGCSRDPAASTSAPGDKPAAAAAAAADPRPPANMPVSKVADDAPLPPEKSPYEGLPDSLQAALEKPFTGDFDEMVKRRLIRAGVVFNRTHYFIDNGVQRGIAYEAFKLFEDDLNTKLKTGNLRIHVVMVPLSRDQLFPALQAGKVDVVAAALTVTPARRQVADFSNPTRSGVSEIVVTAPGAPAVATPDDLSGREVFVRKSSSYYESVTALNQSLTAKHRPPVTIKEAPEELEDDDILEMINAGLVDATVTDDYMVEVWRQVFKDIQPQPAAVRSGGELAVGLRKNSPQMLAALNAWIKKYGARTTFGNTMNRRYLESSTYVKSASADAERAKLQTLVKFFQTYGSKYDVDYLLMAAQGYQESRLDQGAKSHVGAVGVMQVMPETGKDLAVGDITQIEPNIHAGVKYFRFMMDEFYKDEPMDPVNKGLMTLASYNAGPNRIRQLRRETAKRGLDPNKWFGNVERVVSERIGRETVTYVSNIYKYYVAYRLVMDKQMARQRAKDAVR